MAWLGQAVRMEDARTLKNLLEGKQEKGREKV
jgi:hypothetical protein